MAGIHYRGLLRAHWDKATARLKTGNDDDVIYACLELRKCLEAYAYFLLSHYLSEASFKLVQKTWQPDKVIKELLAIEPMISASGQVWPCRVFR